MKKPIDVLSGFKSGNSMIFVLAGLYAKEKGVNNCLILNNKNTIAEAIGANVFVVKGNVILTPSLQEGCVDGIMRRVVIETARQNGIKIYDNCSIELKDLERADEIFLTNAINGIQWVSAFNKNRYFNKMSKSLLSLINKKYLH